MVNEKYYICSSPHEVEIVEISRKQMAKNITLGRNSYFQNLDKALQNRNVEIKIYTIDPDTLPCKIYKPYSIIFVSRKMKM